MKATSESTVTVVMSEAEAARLRDFVNHIYTPSIPDSFYDTVMDLYDVLNKKLDHVHPIIHHEMKLIQK